ncbi:MAG: uridine diphosphate-N-acetylglucosamine-binding protein YvcK [Candidatus Riflebacteria bacterium]|nr:uridine diphosphate-N-acetylglucosamine-binding protein YvcK [Candidatus Riflebacteria bacterium]
MDSPVEDSRSGDDVPAACPSGVARRPPIRLSAKLLRRGVLLVLLGLAAVAAGTARFWSLAWVSATLAGQGKVGLTVMAIGCLAALVGVMGLGLPVVRARRLARGLNRRAPVDSSRSRIRGPRIVALGGGTGLSCLLKGLKAHTSNLTAVVTVADDGGSSGRLRRDFSMLPPGDARNCIVALAQNEGMLADLFQYRFEKGGDLAGHSFGNLLIAALTEITGDFLEALRISSKVLAIRGEVFPSTLENVVLKAELESGDTVEGESRIPLARQRIRRISLSPAAPEPPPAVLERIREADLIVLGPGSFFTSIVPNLLVNGVAAAVAGSAAPVVYVANLMTQPGETDRFTLGDHLAALRRHAGLGRIDFAVVNSAPIDPAKLRFYETRGAVPVRVGQKTRMLLGHRLVEEPLTPDMPQRRVSDVIRHDPVKLARVLIRIAEMCRRAE